MSCGLRACTTRNACRGDEGGESGGGGGEMLCAKACCVWLVTLDYACCCIRSVVEGANDLPALDDDLRSQDFWARNRCLCFCASVK